MRDLGVLGVRAQRNQIVGQLARGGEHVPNSPDDPPLQGAAALPRRERVRLVSQRPFRLDQAEDQQNHVVAAVVDVCRGEDRRDQRRQRECPGLQREDRARDQAGAPRRQPDQIEARQAAQPKIAPDSVIAPHVVDPAQFSGIGAPRDPQGHVCARLDEGFAVLHDLQAVRFLGRQTNIGDVEQFHRMVTQSGDASTHSARRS